MKKSIALSLLLALGLPFGQAFAAEEPATNRISGENRYETSVKLSEEGWYSSDVAVIATGVDFPDALSATPLAYKYDAPLLLTGTNSLPGSVAEELERLEVSKVFLIGGASVISENVVKQLNGLGITVTRISGKDRYETSVNIAKKIGQATDVVVAAGQSFPDALSIAPMAALMETPILLTRKEALPGSVATYIDSQDSFIGSIVVGGSGVISENVMNELPDPMRLSGANRYNTNAAVISYFAEEGLLDMDFPFIATGQNYPDALSASVLAAGWVNGVILTDPNGPKTSTKAVIQEYADLASEYQIVGGQQALPDSAVKALFE
ncbi:cell wall-binding repeat-containing protein [Bacillus sp. SA1-12]|uniref:cell wall-binding repeat-containing protein n=1 Tax=Bacillus sp. SA1-12 TaxID=1455638 RepID=UPI0006972B9F|nr:cell wall-binding repeat-containing protein [Bacillus sp. SA1-12]